ncbi:hypothetical protein [Candidatus Enterovibrio escicola]|uniref:Uncharacterized protein n=1 Tax=Candidatus Enterovibrio escicola TaxID=1927127 RepID=A0A2A5T385_9GAMM|nr:hypothetical protein [Candidatus Enterovibrio escacola]PCS22578.1 hypothetical protein BTN49_1801 [Candidatus Enterovibrio escacola]
MGPKNTDGDMDYGGFDIAFFTYCIHSNEVKVIDYQFFNPWLNGDLKTKALKERN